MGKFAGVPGPCLISAYAAEIQHYRLLKRVLSQHDRDNLAANRSDLASVAAILWLEPQVTIVMVPPDEATPPTDAAAFHILAGSFLAAHGFSLVGHPEAIGMYGGSTAWYRSRRGLWLMVTFNPVDGEAAWVDCGRLWSWRGKGIMLSNGYSSLARRFGFDVPRYYPMADADRGKFVPHQIYSDLERTLPLVASRISLADLVALENEAPKGAALLATSGFSPDQAKDLQISEFIE